MMRLPRLSRGPKLLILAVIVIAAGYTARMSADAVAPGPDQPIPFSHRVHAGTKQISCFFCHPYAGRSSNPGIPPVEKCLLCHNVIATNFTPIAKIQQYDRKKQGIPWVRVTAVPDFVQFNHQCHIADGVDCGRCHGNVKAMDRINLVHTIDMNFCITCHRQYKASVDCYTCHY
jgi:hypothetical protein